MLLQAQVYADGNAFILHHTDYRYVFNALQILCVRVSSPVLQISKWMVKMEWEREESLFISV